MAVTPPVVLIVEDDADTRDLLCVGLQMHGIEGEVAATGREALAKASEILPDAILLDIGLPDMDGKDVCRRLRQAPATRSTPIIAFTAYAMPREVQGALEAGCNAVIVKPSAFPAVLEELRRQLPSRFPPE
jgi:CheY-like chemotaxis protein